MSAGKTLRSENDGCLVAIGNVVLAFFGGGLGFLLLINYFPYFILSSMAGAIAFRALATNAFIRRARKVWSATIILEACRAGSQFSRETDSAPKLSQRR